MSDTEGMVRIMEHAAESLRAVREKREMALTGDVIASMAYARAVLQMVAASVTPEHGKLADRLEQEYETWAEFRNDAADLTHTELASVARFIRSEGW